ncbi:VCBS repeat-containing protein [Haloquadratum walsbyi]|uniref:FG-GAP repeat domain-containing protein n=1 Tax=Haloquadratum walsbyi TaxID=293091 RepID=UPI0026EF299E|nr:VCBS repeat-containing protein [Haloquadratum walsbyi]
MSYTRRGAIALIIGGSVFWASETGAFSSAETTRSATMSAGSGETTLLGIQGIDSQTVVEEPQTITLTNRTQSSLEVTIQSRNNRFNFSTSQLRLNSDSGQSGDTSVSTATDQTGDVSDVIQFLAESPENGTNIQVARQLTIRSDSLGANKGQLVYAVKTDQSNGDIRVYDPVADTVNEPPQTRPASALGDTADIVGDSTADIPYLTKEGSNRIFATTVGNNEDTKIPKSNSTNPKIDPNKPTRIAVGEWQPATLSGKLILAESNQGNIAGVDPDGNAEIIAQPGNGCSAVMGVADIDNDGTDEIIFFDGSQEIRYLNQDGSTEKVQTGGVGSNNGSGIGPPADFDGDGIPRIPFINGSQNPALITVDGKKTILNKNGVARKAGVAPVDIDADGDLELLFLGNDEGKIQYVDDVLSSNTIKTLKADGKTITPVEKVGLGFGRK